MATAGAVRAAKGASQAPARSARPCSTTVSRSAEKGGGGDQWKGHRAQLLRSKSEERR